MQSIPLPSVKRMALSSQAILPSFVSTLPATRCVSAIIRLQPIPTSRPFSFISSKADLQIPKYPAGVPAGYFYAQLGSILCRKFWCAFCRGSGMPFTGGERPVGDHSTAGSALVHHRTTQTCHSRGAKRRGNLGEAVAISPMAFLRSDRLLRDCHVGLWPPRNDKSGGQHRFNGGRYGSGGAFPRLPRRPMASSQ